MKPSHIKQALDVRILRAKKAERIFNQARAKEANALEGLHTAQLRLEDFDRSYEERVTAFFEKSFSGTSPDTLYSARTFHSDFSQERDALTVQINEAQQIVSSANVVVTEKRGLWAAASRAADNLQGVYDKAVLGLKRNRERREEMDADEMSLARRYRV